jgi:hypothetical protein
MNRLSNNDIKATLAMVEARLASEPETAAEWLCIRDALRACANEAEKRVPEA